MKMGFWETSGICEKNGIKFVPMVKYLYDDFSIREMMPQDYDMVYSFWSNTKGMGLSDADSFDNIVVFLKRNKGLSFICQINGEVAGTILCGTDFRRGYIYHAAVSEKYRLKKIGSVLVKLSLNELEKLGVNKCHLFVFADNDEGMKFWENKNWSLRSDIKVFSKNID